MLKPSFLSLSISVFLKYFIFYLSLMIINKEFKMIDLSNLRNGQDLFYFLWLVFFFPIIDIIMFAIPLGLSFKIKNRLLFLINIIAILLIEYFTYVYFTSHKLVNRDAFLKVIINILLLSILFYKTIRLKYLDD